MIGDKQHPCRNDFDISIALMGETNCNIYTKGTFEISNQNLIDAKARNIKFVGINEMRRNQNESYFS